MQMTKKVVGVFVRFRAPLHWSTILDPSNNGWRPHFCWVPRCGRREETQLDAASLLTPSLYILFKKSIKLFLINKKQFFVYKRI
jgi:hypothetical protein